MTPAQILTRLAELVIEERAEFAKQDLRARELGRPNEGWQATAWILEERGQQAQRLAWRLREVPMKVLKPGTGQKGWSSNSKCTGSGNGGGGCQAELLVEEPDVFVTWSGANYGGDSPEPCATFRCSECGVLTDLSGFPGEKLRALAARSKR